MSRMKHITFIRICVFVLWYKVMKITLAHVHLVFVCLWLRVLVLTKNGFVVCDKAKYWKAALFIGCCFSSFLFPFPLDVYFVEFFLFTFFHIVNTLKITWMHGIFEREREREYWWFSVALIFVLCVCVFRFLFASQFFFSSQLQSKSMLNVVNGINGREKKAKQPSDLSVWI